MKKVKVTLEAAEGKPSKSLSEEQLAEYKKMVKDKAKLEKKKEKLEKEYKDKMWPIESEISRLASRIKSFEDFDPSSGDIEPGGRLRRVWQRPW